MDIRRLCKGLGLADEVEREILACEQAIHYEEIEEPMERLFSPDTWEQGIRETEGVLGEDPRGMKMLAVCLRCLQKTVMGDVPWERALSELLLQVMCEAEDTNLQKRGGEQGLAYAQAYARRLLGEEQVSTQALEEMDQAFIERNLSPGGCADLLAVVCFFYFWEKGEGAGA